MSRAYIFLGALVAIAFVVVNSLYIVDERKQAIVLQFGQIKEIRTEPGLGFKLPFIQNVVYYEDRILPLDTSPLEVTPLDDRRLVVEAFARWRITNVETFRLAVGAGGEATGASRLESILNAALRGVLGNVRSNDILSTDRASLMVQIRDSAIGPAQNLGVEIIDVRIKRADLPPQNLQATFARMQAEREREAADERARGQEAAQIVRATADRQAVEIVSEARKNSDIIRGEADAARNAIFADAFGRDPEFFAFYRSMAAYERALQGDNSTLVISPDSEFFNYLKNDGGGPLQ
ncbi:MAG: protease modulator HflC [Pseudomonadota bacterium]